MGVNSKVKAVFLDRDGVLNKAKVIDGKPFPPGSLDEVEILEGVKEGLEQLRLLGYLLIVVTNQPDVSRGKTPLMVVEGINGFLMSELNLDEVYSCFHDSSDNCDCRKPKPGMIISAAEKWNINLDKSFLIGDRWRDIETGKNAGVITILLDNSYDEKYVVPDYVCKNFIEATQIIISFN